MSSKSPYYSSGDLEAYLLGMLSIEESLLVEKALASDPLLQEELKVIEQNLLDYAKAHAVPPPENLKSRVFNRLQKEGYPLKKTSTQTEKNISSSKINWTRSIWLYAASFALFLSLGLNFYLYQKNVGLQLNLNEVSRSYEELLQDEVKWTHTVSELEFTLRTLAYNSVSIELQPQVGFEDLEARIFWDNTTGKTHLAPKNLPALSEAMTYQLWFIRDGTPQSLGVFDSENDLILEVEERVLIADAFAISIEPSGGSIQPTPNQICLVGLVSG